MNLPFLTRAAPFLVTTLLVVPPVWAQSMATPGTGQVAGMPSGTAAKAAPSSSRAAATGRQQGETMQQVVERRIAELHSRLHITPEQDPQWNQYAAVLRDNAVAIDQSYRERAEKLSSMTAVDAMQSYAQIEQQRASDGQKLVAAFQTLYTAMSDQQKRTADQMFRSFAENAQQRHQATAPRGG